MDGVLMKEKMEGIRLNKGGRDGRIKRFKTINDEVEDYWKNKRSNFVNQSQPSNDPVVGVLVSSNGDVVEESSRNNITLSHGLVSVCGRRRTMEDTVTVVLGLLSLSSSRMEMGIDFFAVYDGHGGSSVATVCRDRLHGLLAKEIEKVLEENEEIDWNKVLEVCFLKMDDEVDDKGNQVANMKSIGSTAIVALIGTNQVIVANCGDSRAVLAREGVAVPLSSDHKPDRPDEMERVEAAGGRVINWNGYRVLGVLATSRSIGDQYLKPYVISVPEVSITERTVKDEFLILASDGLWDVMTNEVACQVVRRCLSGRIGRKCSNSVKGSSAGEAAAVLVELAMARGTKDNISVVVIELNKSR
ncbi:phosphatase 2C [Thalictrum thalictroides]|uniref:protein-serine/threonine phosphatase n=1 Tax=Thalictrum thalictroides TaxID=46969 RepID=A0A7J6X4Y0_THATH|nr:phosphatase 2C [Thalictrum thalictroides]